MRPPPFVAENVPLAPLTTFELGGAAHYFVEAADETTLFEALRWATAHGVAAEVLGGGSNLVVPDAGYPGLVVRMATRGISFVAAPGETLVEVAAGEPWDPLVAETVARGLAGLECLSGIPGSVGATPIQNVGAYGAEVADTIRSVRVLSRRTLSVATMGAEACGFSYRNSVFKQDPDRHVVLSVTFALRPGGTPTLRYGELRAALPAGNPTLAEVRDTVLALRRRKSMVIAPADPNRRSAGSFFTNPIVSAADADTLAARAIGAGIVADPAEIPRYPAADPGAVKLSAGWLIDRAGLKGHRAGPVGVSDRHALALIHHGGGTTEELIALARFVRARVHALFGVTLAPEPILLGGRWDEALGPLV